MNCNEIKQLLDRFVNGELDASDRTRFESHLKICSDCRFEVHAQKKAWQMLAELSEIEPAPDYLERFRRRVAAEAPWYQKLIGSVQSLFRRRWALPAFSTALATLLLVAIISSGYFSKPGPDGIIVVGNDIDMELLAHMELVEDYEIINELDLLSDLDVIEMLNGRSAS